MEWGTNVPLASYYDTDDHDGGPPAGLQEKVITNGLQAFVSPAQEYYQFTCWDNAAEKLAEIDLIVREWNELGEFLAGDSGNPDSREGEFEPSGSPYDDLNDWRIATPGADTYIQFAQ